MRLINQIKWYYRIKKLRSNGKYPVNPRHIWKLAKVMSREL